MAHNLSNKCFLTSLNTIDYSTARNYLLRLGIISNKMEAQAPAQLRAMAFFLPNQSMTKKKRRRPTHVDKKGKSDFFYIQWV